jgi:hypothetical protein
MTLHLGLGLGLIGACPAFLDALLFLESPGHPTPRYIIVNSGPHDLIGTLSGFTTLGVGGKSDDLYCFVHLSLFIFFTNKMLV